MSMRLLWMAIMGAARAANWLELDYIEYATDGAAQAAYVSNAVDSATQSQTDFSAGYAWWNPDSGAGTIANSQGFKVTTTDKITRFIWKLKQAVGNETGTLTGYIYSDDGTGKPNAVLATFSNIAVNLLSTTAADYSFSGSFIPTANTQYHMVVIWTGYAAGATNIYFGYTTPSAYVNGERGSLTGGAWSMADQDAYFYLYQEVLQSYSEATIKTQGDYALKAVAAITDSLNKTLAHTFLPDQQQMDYSTHFYLGDSGDFEYRVGQSFKLSKNLLVSGLDIYFKTNDGSPSGNVTLRIETDNGGYPSGTLADANATKAIAPTISSWNNFTFATPFTLTGNTTYWIKLDCDNQSTSVAWHLGISSSSVYADGAFAYKENATWKNDITGDLAFKIHTPLDLTGVDTLKLQMRASRTGANIKLGLHDTGGTTTEITPTITTAGAFQEVTWDFSGVTDANKNAIDTLTITIVNADAANVAYLDNFIYQEA